MRRFLKRGRADANCCPTCAGVLQPLDEWRGRCPHCQEPLPFSTPHLAGEPGHEAGHGEHQPPAGVAATDSSDRNDDRPETIIGGVVGAEEVVIEAVVLGAADAAVGSESNPTRPPATPPGGAPDTHAEPVGAANDQDAITVIQSRRGKRVAETVRRDTPSLMVGGGLPDMVVSCAAVLSALPAQGRVAERWAPGEDRRRSGEAARVTRELIDELRHQRNTLEARATALERQLDEAHIEQQQLLALVAHLLATRADAHLTPQRATLNGVNGKHDGLLLAG